MAILIEDQCLGCPKTHHCASLSQYELQLGKSPFCSDAQYNCAEDTSITH